MKIYKLVLLVVILFASSQIGAQVSQEGYVLVLTKGDILDCPHFGVLLPDELKIQKKIELLKTDDKTYMLFKAKEYKATLTEDFYEVAKSIQFPVSMIQEIVVKEEYEEIEKLLTK